MSVASRRFKKHMESVRNLFAFAGGDVFAENFKITHMTYYSALLIVATYIFTFFSIRNATSQDLILLMSHASCFILTTLAICKLYVHVKHAPDMYNMYQRVSGIIEEYEKAGEEFQHAISIYLERLEKVWWYMRMIFVPYLAEMTFPLVYYFIFGKKMLFIEYTVGDFSTETAFWYIVLIQAAQITSFGVGMVTSDYSLIMQLMNMALLADIIKAKVNSIERKMLNIQTDSAQSSITLRDVARDHIAFDGFTQLVKGTYSVQISTQVIACILVISLSVITAVFGNWVPGYIICLLFYTILFSYCLLGTIFEMVHDLLTEKLYDFKWYLFPVREQKILLILLMKSQHPHLLDIMELAPLNISTGVQVTKSIYSYMVMLRQFLE